MIRKFNAQVRERGFKFDSLLRRREQEFPNESYDERFIFVCNSDAGAPLVEQMKKAGEPSSERYDPKVLADSKQQFKDLVERLALEPKWAGPDNLARTAFAQEKHPEGKKLFKLWKYQELLKKKEELAKAQAARSPHLY